MRASLLFRCLWLIPLLWLTSWTDRHDHTAAFIFMIGLDFLQVAFILAGLALYRDEQKRPTVVEYIERTDPTEPNNIKNPYLDQII